MTHECGTLGFQTVYLRIQFQTTDSALSACYDSLVTISIQNHFPRRPTPRNPSDNPPWPAPAIPTAAARTARAHVPPSARLAAAPRARARAARPPVATAARLARSRTFAFSRFPEWFPGKISFGTSARTEPASDVFAADRAKGFDRAVDMMFTTARRPSCNSLSLNLY